MNNQLEKKSVSYSDIVDFLEDTLSIDRNDIISKKCKLSMIDIINISNDKYGTDLIDDIKNHWEVKDLANYISLNLKVINSDDFDISHRKKCNSEKYILDIILIKFSKNGKVNLSPNSKLDKTLVNIPLLDIFIYKTFGVHLLPINYNITLDEASKIIFNKLSPNQQLTVENDDVLLNDENKTELEDYGIDAMAELTNILHEDIIKSNEISDEESNNDEPLNDEPLNDENDAEISLNIEPIIESEEKEYIINENNGIHCSSRKLCDKISDIVSELGYNLKNGHLFTKTAYYNNYKENTVYLLHKGIFKNIMNIDTNVYNIIKAEDFIQLYKENKIPKNDIIQNDKSYKEFRNKKLIRRYIKQELKNIFGVTTDITNKTTLDYIKIDLYALNSFLILKFKLTDFAFHDITPKTTISDIVNYIYLNANSFPMEEMLNISESENIENDFIASDISDTIVNIETSIEINSYEDILEYLMNYFDMKSNCEIPNNILKSDIILEVKNKYNITINKYEIEYPYNISELSWIIFNEYSDSINEYSNINDDLPKDNSSEFLNKISKIASLIKNKEFTKSDCATIINIFKMVKNGLYDDINYFDK